MKPSAIKKHTARSYEFSKQINTLLVPLSSQTEVRYFGYNRYYPENKFIGLYSDPTPAEIELGSGRGPVFVDASGVVLEDGTYIHADLEEILKLTVDESQVYDLFQQQGNPLGEKIVNNGLLIIRRGVGYDESFYFSLLESNIQDFRAYYKQIMPILKQFCLYFLDKGKKLIQAAEQDKVTYPIPTEPCQSLFDIDLESDRMKNVLTSMQVSKYSVSTEHGEVFLSKQELNCLKHLAQGMTQKEIALALQLEPRTIESYIKNLKNKLNLDSKQQLVKQYEHIKQLYSEMT